MHLLKVAMNILEGSTLLQFIMHAFTEGSREDIGRFHFTPVDELCVYSGYMT